MAIQENVFYYVGTGPCACPGVMDDLFNLVQYYIKKCYREIRMYNNLKKESTCFCSCLITLAKKSHLFCPFIAIMVFLKKISLYKEKTEFFVILWFIICLVCILLQYWFCIGDNLLASIVLTAGGGAVFWLTKKKDREAEIRKEKNDVYRKFISILIETVTHPNSKASQIGGDIDNKFLEVINKLAILSSNKVLDKLFYYRDYKIVDCWRKFSTLECIESNKGKFREKAESLEFGHYALYDQNTGDYEIIAKMRCNTYKSRLLSSEIKYEPRT